MKSGSSSAALLGMWLLGVQVAQGWLLFVSIPESMEWLEHYAGTESLSERAIMVLSFAQEVTHVKPYVWLPAWAMLVLGFAWASFRGRSWSVRMAVAFLVLMQLAGIAWAHQVVQEERVRVQAGSRI